MCVSIFISDAIDVYRPHGALSSWNSVSFFAQFRSMWQAFGDMHFYRIQPPNTRICLRSQKQVTLDWQGRPQVPRALYNGS